MHTVQCTAAHVGIVCALCNVLCVRTRISVSLLETVLFALSASSVMSHFYYTSSEQLMQYVERSAPFKTFADGTCPLNTLRQEIHRFFTTDCADYTDGEAKH